MGNEEQWVEEKTWREFIDTGLLWFINSILHVFGWSIVYVPDIDDIVRVYPARVKYRGFSTDLNTQGYQRISEYMAKNCEELLEESKK